jgi:hypothetical protein
MLRGLQRYAALVAGMAVGLGLGTGAARADDRYYLDDGCRPGRVHEPAHVRVYEPVRLPSYGAYYYVPYVDPCWGLSVYPRDYRRHDRDGSLRINVRAGACGDEYRSRFRGVRYRSYGYRRYCD